MRQRRVGSIFILLATLALAGERATAADLPCLYSYSPGAAGTLRFDAYPARMTTTKLYPPNLKAPEARPFRTAIAKGAAAGVNFAGQYTVVGWGCGSSCLEWAIVDRLTGRVHFDAALRVVDTAHVDDDASEPGVNRDFQALRFRPDSRLLVVHGAPQEDAAREGITFLHWTGVRFEQVGFAKPICREAR